MVALGVDILGQIEDVLGSAERSDARERRRELVVARTITQASAGASTTEASTPSFASSRRAAV